MRWSRRTGLKFSAVGPVSVGLAVVVAVGLVVLLHAGRGGQSLRGAPVAVASSTPPPGSLAASFAALSSTLPGTVGLAYAPVGTNNVVALGNWKSGVAWSTSKAPLAVAALRANPTAALTYAVPAITESDNAAAEKLWSLLGPPTVAAAAVQAVLREGGDSVTVVQSQRVRPAYTAFGQTQWSTTQQALFAAHLPCIQDGGQVLGLMEKLISDQQWGLAQLPGAAAKGGWGPDESGAYLVRQLGVVPNGSGQTAIVIAAKPNSGTFADGITLLNRLEQWVAQNLPQLPTGHC